MNLANKIFWKQIFILFSILILIFYLFLTTNPITFKNNSANNTGEMRGVWVATVLNLDYPTSPTVSSTELASQADQILSNAASYGFNTIFLQVRPCSDAFYDSKFYPWSAYLTGKQNMPPDSGFDPLTYWVQSAHKRGMELHAWINPFRIARSADE